MAMTLRLSPELDHQLTELARTQGLSKQQMVHRLIEDAASGDRRRKFIDEQMDRILVEDAELLGRLAQ